MQDLSFNGYLLNFCSILCFKKKNLIIIGFSIVIVRIQRPISCYKQPFIECGVLQCLDGLFILFDRTIMQCLSKRNRFLAYAWYNFEKEGKRKRKREER
jgi:hypothetical protein